MFDAIADEIVSADDRAAWLAAREDSIGASEIGAVLRLDPYLSVQEVYARKLGLEAATEDETSEAAAWGSLLEATVAQRWAAVVERRCVPCGMQFVLGSGRSWSTHPELKPPRTPRAQPRCGSCGRVVRAPAIYRCAALWRSREHPFLHATPDYVISEAHRPAREFGAPAHTPGLLQVKVSTAAKWLGWEIPVVEYAQVQQELLVTGCAWGELAVLFFGPGGGQLRRYRVEASADWHAAIVEQAGEFWEALGAGTQPPEFDAERDPAASVRRACALLYPEAKQWSLLRLEGEEWTRKLDDLVAARAAIAEAKASEDRLQAEFRLAAGDAQRVLLDDRRRINLATNARGARPLRIEGGTDR